jgi:dTDP-4-dehydrorhamnose reductase
MTIFVAGSTGLAGSAIVQAAKRRGHSVIGAGWASATGPRGVDRYLRTNLAEETNITRAVLDIFPDVVVNAAAISEPFRCEQDPAGTARLNVDLPVHLARLAHHVSARFIHLSTDMVFDGKASHYSPASPTNPTSEYGRQKRRAEEEILRLADGGAVIVRTTLLTGNSPGGRRSVHEKLFEAWADGQRPRLFTDELRQPCLAENLAEAVVELCERNDCAGLNHWAGAEEISRFDIGRRILEKFKLPDHLIEPNSLADDPRFAGRPADLSLDTSSLTGKLKTRPLTFDAQLDTMVVPPPFRDWFNSI